MREITGLGEKIRQGRVGVKTLQSMLDYEQRCLAPQFTMLALGGDSKYHARVAGAEAELEESRQTALRNIPIIEGYLRELGGSTKAVPVRKLDCGHTSREIMNTSQGTSCPDCFDRMSE